MAVEEEWFLRSGGTKRKETTAEVGRKRAGAQVFVRIVTWSECNRWSGGHVRALGWWLGLDDLTEGRTDGRLHGRLTKETVESTQSREKWHLAAMRC